MGLDMAKYRRIFLEESADHLGEISTALLELEKDQGSAEAIDTIFRMAHSIKSMAASLGYDAVADLSHRMEDRMEGLRAAGRVRGHDELGLLFRSLETLEAMVAAVEAEADPDPAPEDLLAALAAPAEAEAAPPDPIEEAAPIPEAQASDADRLHTDLPEPVGGEPKKALS